MLPVQEAEPVARPRLRKRDRRSQILLELKLRPHLRISELAERFGVSSETVRRDFEALSADGLLSRAHGGGSAPGRGHYPGLDERSRDRLEERERIGRLAATLVQPGDAVMIDAGSTTLQLARFLAFNATPCTVLTNSLPLAMTMGQSDAANVILCPGDYLASESAVVGPDAVDFLDRHNVDRCFIGASGLSANGASETVRGFAAIKRAMLRRSAMSHLLIDSGKFDARGLARVGGLDRLSCVVTDTAPGPALGRALNMAGVTVMVTP